MKKKITLKKATSIFNECPMHLSCSSCPIFNTKRTDGKSFFYDCMIMSSKDTPLHHPSHYNTPKEYLHAYNKQLIMNKLDQI